MSHNRACAAATVQSPCISPPPCPPYLCPSSHTHPPSLLSLRLIAVTVTCVFTVPKPGMMSVLVYCPYWCVDRTGLGLNIGTKDVDNSSYIFGTKFKRVNPPSVNLKGSVTGEPLALSMLSELRIHGKGDYKLCLDPIHSDPVYSDRTDLSWSNTFGPALPSSLQVEVALDPQTGKPVKKPTTFAEFRARPTSDRRVLVQIVTPSTARMTKGTNLISFTTVHPSTIFVLFDSAASAVPFWLLKDFTKLGLGVTVGDPDSCVGACERRMKRTAPHLPLTFSPTTHWHCIRDRLVFVVASFVPAPQSHNTLDPTPLKTLLNPPVTGTAASRTW